jgi:hypothetical protein
MAEVEHYLTLLMSDAQFPRQALNLELTRNPALDESGEVSNPNMSADDLGHFAMSRNNIASFGLRFMLLNQDNLNLGPIVDDIIQAVVNITKRTLTPPESSRVESQHSID